MGKRRTKRQKLKDLPEFSPGTGSSMPLLAPGASVGCSRSVSNMHLIGFSNGATAGASEKNALRGEKRRHRVSLWSEDLSGAALIHAMKRRRKEKGRHRTKLLNRREKTAEDTQIHPVESNAVRSKSNGQAPSACQQGQKTNTVKSINGEIIQSGLSNISGVLKVVLVSSEDAEMPQRNAADSDVVRSASEGRFQRQEDNDHLHMKAGQMETGNGLSAWHPENRINMIRKPSKKALKLRRELQATREALPIYQARHTITSEIMNNRSIVIVGETGSGKTTQIPQFLYDAGLTERGMIAVTQPRRVAAISIAKRVADEMGSKLGDKVGYSIRFDDTTSPGTKIKYMTDGMLLRELLGDNSLRKYSAIILDEAHERTLRTDILFGMVKAIQKERSDLKVIVMSATLNAEKFSEYFDNAKVLYVAGRQFPVRIFAAAQKQEDYVDSALVAIFQIHMEQPAGDILVFLTGQEEIDNLQKLIEESARNLPPTCLKMLICPIYAKLPTEQQTRVFEQTPSGTRKIILSTNVAETSITISGIRYVIDTGMAKIRSYNAKVGMETLAVQPISRASARQRSGRAGREAPGFCYRLYTERAYDALDEDTEPEIMRCSLASVVLLLKASGVHDVLGFDYVDKPSRTSIVRALEQLYALGALKDDGSLSLCGHQMAQLPLDPIYAKVVLQSSAFKCTREVLSIIAMLSVDTVFYSPPNKRDQAGQAKKRFTNYDGDHVTLYNVMKSFQSVHGDSQWCNEHFISSRSLKQALEIRKQLVDFAERMGIDTTVSCGADFDPVLKCFLSGCFQNVAMQTPDGLYRAVMSNQIVYIHPSSVLFLRKPQAVVYNELMHTTKKYMRNVSAIQPQWLLEVAPQYYGRVSGQVPN